MNLEPTMHPTNLHFFKTTDPYLVMESIRAAKQGEKNPVYEDFHPKSEWTEDSANHVLHVYLPGFLQENLRVRVDHNSMKLTVIGLKMVRPGKYLRLEESYDLPKDSISNKVTGRFEDGRLIVLVRKKPPEQQQQQQPATFTESQEQHAEQLPSKQDDDQKPVQDKKQPQPSTDEEKPAKPPQLLAPPSPLPKQEEKPVQQQQLPPPAPLSKQEEKPVQQQQLALPPPPSKPEEKQVQHQQPSQLPPSKTQEMDQEARGTKASDENKEKNSSQLDSSTKELEEEVLSKKRKLSEEVGNVSDGVASRAKKSWRESDWKEKGREVLLDCGQKVEKLWEKINRNRNVIAVAVVAFSVGFFVSRKLRPTPR